MFRRDFNVDGVQFYLYDLDGSITAQYCQEHFDVNYYGIKDLQMKDGQIFIDLGANIGSQAFYIAKKFPNVKVVAIEALSHSYELMKKATEEQNLSNVICINTAVTSDRRAFTISVDNGMSGGAKEGNSGELITNHKETMTLQDVLDQYTNGFCDVLKTNIEGGEYEILDNCSDEWLLSRFGNIIGELHLWRAQEMDERLKKLYPQSVFTHA